VDSILDHFWTPANTRLIVRRLRECEFEFRRHYGSTLGSGGAPEFCALSAYSANQEFRTPERKAAFLIPLASQSAHSWPSSRRAVFS
jgi:hypothetical protein